MPEVIIFGGKAFAILSKNESMTDTIHHFEHSSNIDSVGALSIAKLFSVSRNHFPILWAFLKVRCNRLHETFARKIAIS